MEKIKRVCLFVIIIFSTCLSDFAQQPFELIIDTDLESGMSDCKEDSDGNYILTGLQWPIEWSLHSNAFIIKVSQTGDTTIRIIDLGDTACALFKVLIADKNNYLLFGAIGIPESNYKVFKNVWVCKIDENLNTVWEKSYKLSGDYWDPSFEVAMTSDSIVYLAGYTALYGSPSYQHLFAMKFNINGDTLKTFYTPGPSPQPKYMYGITVQKDNNGIITFGSGFDYNMTFMQALEIDSNLNLTVFGITDPLSTGMDNVTAKRFTDSTYLLSCRATGLNGDNDIELVLMSDEHQIIEQHWAGRIDTSDYPAWRTSMDYIDKNNIWVSGSLQHFPSDHINTNILLFILDSTLNIKGMKCYGGDKNYSAMTTTSTTDDQDLWIKKVFPNDILTNAEDTPDPNDRDVLIYPNPFNDKIIIKTIRKDLKISLYTINGINVIESEIENNLDCRINTSNLEKGAYIYEIKYGNRIIQTGKVIKQ
ncbi:MAG: hypothetical protein B6D61_09060 [Bacteroidetes bacterium 4484_249]|nr:MAG: hypothetical protein B6D61_09060 [Bacteroidetes bacterium 4484_249]